MFLEYFLCNACVVFSPTFFNIYQCDWIKLKKGLHNHENSFWIRLRSIGKSDLDFEIHTSDFTIEREIRKRISPPRNPSSMWLPTKKSKSGFRWFPYFPFDWEIQKLFPWTVVFFQLIMRARARPLSLRTVLKILPKISQKKKKRRKGYPRKDFSVLKSVFGYGVRFQIRNPDPHFKIELNLSKLQFRKLLI